MVNRMFVKPLAALFFLFVLLPIISATCQSGQIDINSASLGELDNLYGIGPVKAQAIIDARSFSSVDDLIDVNGIGEVTLNGIKAQGLACVVNEEENSEEDEELDEFEDNLEENSEDLEGDAEETDSVEKSVETPSEDSQSDNDIDDTIAEEVESSIKEKVEEESEE